MMLFAGAGSAGIDLGTLFPGVKGATAGNLAAWLIVDVAEPAPIIALAIDGGATNNTVRLEMDRNSSNEITSRGRAPDGGSQESTNGPLPTVGAYNHYLTGYNITGDLGFIYQNGVLDASAAKAFAPATFDGTNHASGGLMSHADPSDSEHSQGRLEDARCYARLLSDNAIQTIHACRGHDGITDGLTFRYRMNEFAPGVTVAGAGSVKDCSNTKQNGTPIGTPTGQESRLSLRRRYM